MTVKPAIPHFCIADARLLLLCIAILCSRFTWGQSIRVLSTKDGLPQSFVSGLVQDKEGFIWIGTRNGLARYDGIQYKIFRHNVNDSTSIASNVIIWMNMDRRNHLWIEYETGDIDELDPVTEKINHFISVNLKHTPQVRFVRRGWLVDSTGVFWGIIKGAGLNSYDKKTKKIDRYRAPAEFPGDTLRGIAEDGSGKIWVLSQRAISFLDKPHHKFVHTTIPFDQDYNNYFDSDEEVVDLHQRPDGGLMWGDRRRLYFFDPSTSGFITVALTHFPDAGIRWIRSGPDSSEYFESGGNVFRYDDFNGLSKVGTVGISNPGDTRSFLADRSGLLWVGTNAAGIHQLDIITPFFKSYAYEKGYPLSLLRQEFGLSMNEMFDWTKEDELFSAPGYHFRSCYDRNRRLWMGLKQTVCYYNFLNQQSVKLPAVPIGRESPQNGIGIKGLTVTARGIPVVIGFNGSIYVYDSLARDWNAFIEPSVLRKTFGTGLLPQDLVADEDRLWITTAQDGLLHINLRTKEIKQLKSDDRAGSLPTNQLLGILEDPSRPGLLWIGSYQGLISVDKKTLLCKLYSLEEGLPDNTVYSIQADGAGDLWISTNKGLCRFNPLTQKTRSFRAAYGLPGDEFNRFHHLKLPDGRLSFGGTEGWTLFDPMTIKNDEFEPVVSLTSLRVNNVLINPAASGSLLKVPVNSLGSLTLSFSDNTIAIGFAGLQFNQPQDLLYRYRLKGYDDDWIETGHSPVASYTKIPPGHYTLLVNASNSNGKWSSYIKTIDILIRPPWWRAWWAWVCYAIALSGLAWAFISFRVKRGLIKQEMQLKERESRQLKELDSMKTRFFANITHEFRTPLTLILGPAGQLKNRYADDVQQKKLTDTITRNANQLLGLINQLMDLAKLEAKAMAPAESIGKPADTIKSVLNSFESEAQSKNILLSFDNSSVEQDYRFAADVLERIVYNLVSNALKFTPEKGTIMVRLATLAGDEGVALTVEDNGSGIAPDRLPHIFDRFYQAHTDTGHEAGKRAGTGIGLSLVKELVELQGGTIQVQSRFRFATEQNPGTIFTITLPYKIADDENEENEPASDLAVALENPGTDDDMRPRVLLAEDSDELADFISDSLAGDYAVSHFSNGALALDNALRLMPDIIISDVLMPVMDGFALTAHIRKDIRTSHIPVILLTAKASHESRIEGLTAGANDYLTKPFHPEELLLRIRNLLEQQTRLQEHARQQLLPAWPKAHGAVTQQEDPFLVKLYGLIEERLDDPLFGVEELVQKMDMSRTSLHRKIKSIAGMSTGDVIRNYRLKRAAVFLLEGNSSTDAAYMSGFGSPAYFTKCFREVNGITPGEFIRQNQQVS